MLTCTVIPRFDTTIMNPPSLPPICRGMKKRRLAKSDVNARMMSEWTKSMALASLSAKSISMKKISKDWSIRPRYSRKNEMKKCFLFCE